MANICRSQHKPYQGSRRSDRLGVRFPGSEKYFCHFPPMDRCPGGSKRYIDCRRTWRVKFNRYLTFCGLGRLKARFKGGDCGGDCADRKNFSIGSEDSYFYFVLSLIHPGAQAAILDVQSILRHTYGCRCTSVPRIFTCRSACPVLVILRCFFILTNRVSVAPICFF